MEIIRREFFGQYQVTAKEKTAWFQTWVEYRSDGKTNQRLVISDEPYRNPTESNGEDASCGSNGDG